MKNVEGFQPEHDQVWKGNYPLEKPIILQSKKSTKPKTHQHLHHELEYTSQELQETQVTTFKKQSSGLLLLR